MKLIQDVKDARLLAVGDKIEQSGEAYTVVKLVGEMGDFDVFRSLDAVFLTWDGSSDTGRATSVFMSSVSRGRYPGQVRWFGTLRSIENL